MEFILNHPFLFGALFMVLVMLFGPQLAQLMNGVKTVSAAQAIQIMNHEGGIVLDVCESKEYQQGHIRSAINIPLANLAARTAELEKHKGKPVIVSCQSGQRSLRAAGMLRKQGFETVYSLAGGMHAWQRDNLPVVK